MLAVPEALQRTIRRPTLWLGVVLSLAGGAALYSTTAEIIANDAAERFTNTVRVAQFTISGRIKSYTDLLRGAAGLFSASPNTTRAQFHDYVKKLDMERNFPGIEVINYGLWIDDAERPLLEQRLRRELAELGIPNERLRIFPPGKRDHYTVLIYIEPSLQWPEKYGMDLRGIPYAAKTSDYSRDHNVLAASGIRVPVISGPNQHGLSMRLPIYRSDMLLNTVEERRAAYIGTIGIGFGVNKLLSGVLDEIPIRGVRLIINDLTPVPATPGKAAQDTLLFDSAATKANPHPARMYDDSSVFHAELPIQFNARVWQADFSIPKSAVYSSFDAFFPWLAMFAGTLSIGLLYALFLTLATSRRRALLMAEEMTKELRTSEARLVDSHQRLRRLAEHSEQIKEHERKRIAREIHDDLGQSLLALRIDTEMLATRTRSRHPLLHERANASLRQIDTTIKSVRQIINDLRPTVLDLGLTAAVEWQVADFQRRTGIACELIDTNPELRIEDRCATALFRILQESLSNIARHAQASQVTIRLQLQETQVSMSVSDNGIGIQRDKHQNARSFGLVGIEERITILGGSFAIDSTPGKGTTIRVTVSVPMSASHSSAPSEQINQASVRPLVV
jgi:signal transduction histidine kinase